MAIKKRPVAFTVAVCVLAASLVFARRHFWPDTSLESAPVLVSDQRHDKKTGEITGVITNRTNRPLASVEVVSLIYVNSYLNFKQKIPIKNLQPSEKRYFKYQSSAGADVERIELWQIHTSEPGHYFAPKAAFQYEDGT